MTIRSIAPSIKKEKTQMLKRISLLLLIILALTCTLAAQIEAPKLVPVAPNENQKRLVAEGIVLHDKKDFDGAIRKYEEALKENADNVEALYEMGFSYSEKQDYKKALELAYRGARYKSNLLTGFYVIAGNSLDHLGESKKAIDVYKAGLKIAPQGWMLHYNLGVTYRNIGKPEDARKSLKKAAAINPDYANSHLVLGDVFNKGNYKTPALLALSRFLVLEPNTPRSDFANRIIQEILQGGVSVGDDPSKITIALNLSDKKDEGDFGGVDVLIGLSKAGEHIEENKGKTKAQLGVGQFELIFAVLAEQSSREKQSKFVWKYYVPYFTEMKSRNYVEPFYYYINRRSEDAEVQKWLDGNFRRVNEFLNWSKQYQWPKIDE
jgi:FOG: TPR repeat